MRKFIGEGALLTNTIIWGATFVIIKNSLDYASPLMFVTFRFLIAAVILLAIYNKKLLKIDKETFKAGSLLGFFLFLGFALQTMGLKYTTATKSAFITGTLVVFTPLLQTIINKKPPTIGSIIGIVFVFLGLAFMSSKGTSMLDVFSELGQNFNVGDFLTLLCAVGWAFYIVYLDTASVKYEFSSIVFLQISATSLFAFLASIFLAGFNIETIKLELNWDLAFGLLYTSLLASLVTTALQTKYQKYVTPSKAGIIFSFEPIFAAVFAYLILSETIGLFGIIGSLFIFIGLLSSEILDVLVKNGRKIIKN